MLSLFLAVSLLMKMNSRRKKDHPRNGRYFIQSITRHLQDCNINREIFIRLDYKMPYGISLSSKFKKIKIGAYTVAVELG